MHKKPGDEAADFLCFLFKNYLGHGTKSHTAPVYTGAKQSCYEQSYRTVVELLGQTVVLKPL